MSIIIQFNSAAFGQSAVAVPSTNRCHSKRNVKLEMVPGIEHSDVPGMTDDENSIDVASSSIYSTTLKEVKITNNHIGSCFGLPYQDHNYGAPPPPTPPSCSPCPSPVPSVPVPDEDTTLSVISNSTNEEVQEESVTRCICGFEHDDEYMICCDSCLVWQHVDCMGLDRNSIPDTYLCDKCEPRKLDRHKAKLLQSRKKSSLTAVKPPTSASTKQEPNFNNRIFGKDFKKKPLGQNAEEWSPPAHKIEFRETPSNVQRFNNYSSDSDDGLSRNSERRPPKTRSKRRKREEEKVGELFEQNSKRKSKKHGKERMEAKRSKLRRGKNKESTSTADEEAQDAWEYSLEWCEKNFEDAINNQYTPEIQHLARKFSPQGFEKRYLEQMRTKQCHAYDDGKRKQLVCLRDLPRNSPLIEYKGKFLLASQFHDIHPLYNKRLYPYVLFYVLDQDEVCVDASMYGNDARFVRRSCKPNAEIRHMVYNGKLHLYLTSTKVIFREDEVTIPLIIHPSDSVKDFECACGTDECLVKPKKKNGSIEVCQEKRRRTRRSTMTADEDSDHSLDIKPTRYQAHSVDVKPTRHQSYTVDVKPTRHQSHSVEVKQTRHQVHLDVKSTRHQAHSIEVKPTRQQVHSIDVKPTRHQTHSVEIKSTRQQTKANLSEKPKQVTIKSEPVESQIIPIENVTTTPVKEEPEVKSTSDYESEEPVNGGKRKQTREERKLDAILRAFRQMEQAEKRKQLALEKQKSHHPKAEIPEEKPESEPKNEEKLATDVSENTCKEEEKVAPQTPKSKKGKRRRGSGTPSRRRTRTNSGGSDLMSMEESSPTKTAPLPETNSVSCTESIIQVPGTSPPPASASGVISPVPTVNPSSPLVLKTKRSLMNEWLQEKSEAVIGTPVSSPLPIHTEMKWNMSSAVATCYVRCTKDTPHSSGISAAHLRRSNSAGHMKPATGGQGSAKKRWLRQAMYDCHGCEIQLKYDPCGVDHPMSFDNGCLSPNSHGDLESLNGVGEDVLTPLKKRRLMRESIESLPSPPSPSTATSIDDTDATTVSNSLISDNSTEHVIDTVDNETSCTEKDQPSPISHDSAENSIHKVDGAETKKSQICDKDKEVNKDSEMCIETFFTPISALKFIPDEHNECVTERTTKNALSASPFTSDKDIKNDVTEELSKPSDLFESINVDNLTLNAKSQQQETSRKTISSEKNLSHNDDISEEISGNQSSSNLTEDEMSDKKDLVAQDHSQDLSVAISASSSVNNETPIETNNTSPTNHTPYSSKTHFNSCDITNQSQTNCGESKSELSDLPLAEDTKDIFPSNSVKICENNYSTSEVNVEKANSPKTMKFVNNEDGDSTNSSSTDQLNQTVSSSVSSCNNVDNSNSFASVQLSDSESAVKDESMEIDNENTESSPMDKNADQQGMEHVDTLPETTARNFKEAVKPDSQSRCTSNEDTSLDVKTCASATQKRKVSLSEYRMRMRENTVRVRSNSETANKNPSATAICAISLPDTLPEQVTLAPLPLFEKVRTRKPLSKQPIQQIASKKKNEDSKKTEQDGDIAEHRENLNERLKREFGFDVSEGNANITSLKSKVPGTSNSDVLKLLGARPSPPPPPPPPRLTRPSQRESVGIAVPQTQFGFTPPPFPRPQFMVPQVPGAPYLPSQPAVHPMNTTTAQCSLQSPLLPTAHPFTPSMTLLRPPQHDYTPVNAQRFAALVQQPPPPPPHKSYLHVYPSGLYK